MGALPPSLHAKPVVAINTAAAARPALMHAYGDVVLWVLQEHAKRPAQVTGQHVRHGKTPFVMTANGIVVSTREVVSALTSN